MKKAHKEKIASAMRGNTNTLGKHWRWKEEKVEKRKKEWQGKSWSPKTQFKKGQMAWNKGKTGWMSKEGRKRISEINRKNVEEKARHWLGDNVGYHGLHIWVKKHLGRPIKCSNCGKTFKFNMKQIHWANKSGRYKRDLSDWVRLCAKCHKKFDQQ
jgi:hypothetical protein